MAGFRVMGGEVNVGCCVLSACVVYGKVAVTTYFVLTTTCVTYYYLLRRLSEVECCYCLLLTASGFTAYCLWRGFVWLFGFFSLTPSLCVWGLLWLGSLVGRGAGGEGCGASGASAWGWDVTFLERECLGRVVVWGGT